MSDVLVNGKSAHNRIAQCLGELRAAESDEIRANIVDHHIRICYEEIDRRIRECKQRQEWLECFMCDAARFRMGVLAAEHLLQAATGPEDGPTSWKETRARWLKEFGKGVAE